MCKVVLKRKSPIIIIALTSTTAITTQERRQRPPPLWIDRSRISTLYHDMSGNGAFMHYVPI
jgi:hypothetical protein